MSHRSTHRLLSCVVACSLASAVLAQNEDDNPRPPQRNAIVVDDAAMEEVSPVRRIRRDPNRAPRIEDDAREALELQAIDGSGNNPGEPAMNSAHTMLVRWLPAAYSDGVAALAGEDRPGAREISNAVMTQDAVLPNAAGLSDFFWQWGQFLDHDLDLTDGTDPAEFANISIPAGDASFDPLATGTVELPLNRSLYDPDTGLGTALPRQQVNEITGWIDASNVYGSDPERALALRELDGRGRLKVSEGNLLPFNEAGLPNAGGPGAHLFLAGDVRANEQVGLTAMHTLFVREHNRQADRIRRADPQLSGDAVYERARARVAALMQVITYREFLPRLLGADALPAYDGYDPTVDAGIMNSFSTAAYRFGHSLLSPQLLRLDAAGDEHEAGNLALRDAFFAPSELTEHGIEPLLRGLAGQVCQRLDVFITDDVRNFLFGAPGAAGFDLAAINIQRGRDHGLPAYNDAREAAGLPRITDFRQVSRNRLVVQRLRSIYPNVDTVDLWVGGLAESPLPGAQVGPLFHSILLKQFAALRDGDRFWYANRFDQRTIDELERTTLADVIRRNSAIERELSDDVFSLAEADTAEREPRREPGPGPRPPQPPAP